MVSFFRSAAAPPNGRRKRYSGVCRPQTPAEAAAPPNERRKRYSGSLPPPNPGCDVLFCIRAVETARWDAKRAASRYGCSTRGSAFRHIRHRIHSVAVVGAQNVTPHPPKPPLRLRYAILPRRVSVIYQKRFRVAFYDQECSTQSRVTPFANTAGSVQWLYP